MVDKKELLEFKNAFLKELAACNDINQIELFYKKKLGIKGELSLLMRNIIHSTTVEEKKQIMPLLHNLRQELTLKLNNKKNLLLMRELNKQLTQRKMYIGEAKENPRMGYIHPNQILITKIRRLLVKQNFTEIFHSPLETSEYNFTRLNVAKTHPAFTSSDTFFTDKNKKGLFRAHCTSSSARSLEANKNKEVATFTIGNVFRRDTDDFTHTHQFMQLDLIKVLKDSNVWEFKLFLSKFIKNLLGKDSKIRFRPSYFPFTSPSFEVDVKCTLRRDYCSVCKNTGWIEILGAGMLHIDVFKKAGYSEKFLLENKIVGWAFGMGIDRLACIIHRIPDTRFLYENRLQFLKHFSMRTD